jgi:hypothetical protein
VDRPSDGKRVSAAPTPRTDRGGVRGRAARRPPDKGWAKDRVRYALG